MFKYWSLKKYGKKLLPTLEKHYGVQDFYTPSQIRTVVYCKDFDPSYLPLAYLLYAAPQSLTETLETEFPRLDIQAYKREIIGYLEQQSYRDHFQKLQEVMNQ
ncbi:DUF6559 family protein [Thalassotalea sp. G2M2-11]|uniref:DUF6559 family protein n=1 Tax=Thalassotalea sp. G2M2-11 TaxID=2787627 RepID=UPI0019D11398|nr:DUF6559 family protein [Thalassotalea sp. G2M2-11]